MTFYESLALFSALPLIYGSVFSEQPHYPACQAHCPKVLIDYYSHDILKILLQWSCGQHIVMEYIQIIL